MCVRLVREKVWMMQSPLPRSLSPYSSQLQSSRNPPPACLSRRACFCAPWWLPAVCQSRLFLLSSMMSTPSTPLSSCHGQSMPQTPMPPLREIQRLRNLMASVLNRLDQINQELICLEISTNQWNS